jgi:hypothetical protein
MVKLRRTFLAGVSAITPRFFLYLLKIITILVNDF